MWPSVPVARSNAEQCRVVPTVVPTVCPLTLGSTLLWPPHHRRPAQHTTAVVVWLPPRSHLLVTRSPGPGHHDHRPHHPGPRGVAAGRPEGEEDFNHGLLLIFA